MQLYELAEPQYSYIPSFTADTIVVNLTVNSLVAHADEPAMNRSLYGMLWYPIQTR